MSFFAVLVALLIEQLRPGTPGAVQQAALSWMETARRNLDAGGRRHSWLVWGAAVLLPAAGVALAHVLLRRWGVVAALVFDIAVLHVCIGFRQFSHHVTAIRDALDRGDWDEARRGLASWRGLDASDWPRSDLVRQVIEHALIDAHRHMFGVFFWYVLLSAFGLGPMGAVLYRLASRARRSLGDAMPARGSPSVPGEPLPAAVAAWGGPGQAASAAGAGAMPSLAQRLFDWIDHVPARMTAFGFAVTGNFEDAVDAWRRAVPRNGARPRNETVLLAAAAGAMNLRIGPAALPQAGESEAIGQPPQPAHLRSVVALVWRSVVLWMLLLALLSLANLVG